MLTVQDVTGANGLINQMQLKADRVVFVLVV